MTPEQASQKYHWIKYDKDTNTIELYMDNYMLSSSRLCEAKFYMEHLLWIKPRYTTNTPKPWFFNFGEYFHWCLEQFYESFKKNKQAPIIDKWLDECKIKWLEMKLDDYAKSTIPADVKRYDDLGGWVGCAGLLAGYYAYYMDQRFRIIDTEITFGHNKEVFLGGFVTYASDETLFYYKCYLTGRIDLLVDNGYKIGPVDHKTTASFDGFEHEDYNPHDGLCGYILAINQIMKNYKVEVPIYDPRTKLPECYGGWIQHISLKQPSTPKDKSKKQGSRYKTTPIDKSPTQLEDYKARQLSTFKRIAELLFNNKTPEWQTTACNNIFFRKCEYKPIHEQPSDQWPKMIEQFYTIGEPWNTLNHSKKEENK